MPSPTSLVAEQRRHPRAQLNLPVRLRWLAPLGSLTEVTQTLDVSRGGLLIHRDESCRAGATVWVAFPFDVTLSIPQPETPARVVRVRQTPSGGYLVALEFEPPPRRRDAAALGRVYARFAGEHRRHERIPLALPIRVRRRDSPWPEETMTVNISSEGVLFCTTRFYAVGETLHIALPAGSFRGPWGSGAELPARVVRVARSPGRIEHQVAAVLLPPEKP